MKHAPHWLHDPDLLDWLDELADGGGSLRLVKSALAKATNSDSEPDADVAGAAWGAAEWTAALRGHPVLGSADVISNYIAAMEKAPKTPPVEPAIAAIERLARGCDQKGRWQEAGFAAEWEAAVADLLTRLAAPEVKLPRPKIVRYRNGHVFQIPLANGEIAYGRVADRDGVTIQIYPHQPTASAPPIGQRPFLFTVNVMGNPIGRGEWPLVGTDPLDSDEQLFIGTRYEDAKVWRYSFEQIRGEFRLRWSAWGRQSSARECQGLEKAIYYSAEDVADRIQFGKASLRYRKNWPLHLAADGSLQPKPWDDWTDADFAAMDELGNRERVVFTWP